jgi:toxin YoeB
MEIILSPDAREDIRYWSKSGNKSIQKKIQELLKVILETPFEGIGKPEALKHSFKGYWSRRINKEHRIIYLVENDKIHIFSLRGHYFK